MRVFLDAGHGGRDPGAVNRHLGLQEKDIVLPITLKLGQILERHGITVGYSRKTDVFVELADRSRMSNNFRADYFISIHTDSNDDASINGTWTWLHPNQTNPLARELAIRINRQLAGLGLRDRGIRTGNFAIVNPRNTNAPSCLPELAFISNSSDAAVLTDRQPELAEAVARGILEQLGIEFSEIQNVKESFLMNPEQMTDMQVDALINRIFTRMNQLPVSEYARQAAMNAVTSGLFIDGDGDGLMDNPGAFITRQHLAIVMDRAGLLD